jgi:G:T/U-mismatch repair DNA glycosylase
MVGDCLGFRRATGTSPSTGKMYHFTKDLRSAYANTIVSTYTDQVTWFVQHGFGVWDLVQSCERPGSSLDTDIEKAVWNDIRGLATIHAPHLRRIVISNGGQAAQMFYKGHTEWFQSGELCVNDDPQSQKILGKKVKTTTTFTPNNKNTNNPITIVVAISPSPAAASYSYVEKRTYWEEYVFTPGLQDYYAWKKEK